MRTTDGADSLTVSFRKPMQYATPFTCPDCSEHTFETEAELFSEHDFTGSSCTNCGHELTDEEINLQGKTLPAGAIPKMLEDAAALNRKYAGH